jgi:tetratricopeptide (TPR) repeat protein/class 3 adenylate cyclase
MPAEIKKEIQLEIAHVLFMDIVGYSKLLIDEQHALLDKLNEIVRGTEQFRIAETAGKLIKIPTGDGMALVFQDRLEAPAECALEISRALKEYPTLPLRMGVHSGPVSGVVDVSGRANVAGAGINMAHRVMDCGDAGHILLSKRVAEDLEQFARWKPLLHDLGECEVKHDVRVHVVNLYTQTLGNPQRPQKIKQAQSVVLRPGSILKRKHLIGATASLLLLSGIVAWLVRAQHWQAAVIQKQGEEVTTIVDRYQKMQQALVRLAAVEAQAKQPGEKLTPEEQRARAYTVLEKELGLGEGTLAKELPAFALELYNRSDITPLERARAAYALNKFDEAEKLSLEGAEQNQKAYETAKRVGEDKRKSALEAYELAGLSAWKQIQYPDSLVQLHKAEQLTERTRDPLEWARIQFGIGQVFIDQGNYRGAERILREVLQERDRHLGPENFETIAARHYIATALWRQGKYAEAEAEFRAVLKLREKVLGPEHPDTLHTRNNLAAVLDYPGKPAEAEAENREILKLREKVLGPEHPDTLASRNNLAMVLTEQGKYAEAEAEYRQVITLQKKVLGPEHPDTFPARNNLIAVLFGQGKYAEAEAEAREVVTLEKKVLGPEHPITLQTRNNLASVLDSQGKYAEAEAEQREIITLFKKAFGPEHPLTLEARTTWAKVLDDQGKYAEAEAEEREVITLEKKALGPEHPNTLEARTNLADALRGQGKYAEAETDDREVIKLKEKVLGREHPDTLLSLYQLALCLRDEGKLNEAMQFASRTAEGAQKVLGVEHPDTQKYEKLLAELEAQH